MFKLHFFIFRTDKRWEYKKRYTQQWTFLIWHSVCSAAVRTTKEKHNVLSDIFSGWLREFKYD